MICWVALAKIKYGGKQLLRIRTIPRVCTGFSKIITLSIECNNTKAVNWTPTELDQWCDNKQAVYNSMHYPCRPTDMLGADMDFVLAIHHLKSTLTTTVHCQHVCGHQDRGRENSGRKEQNHPAQQKKPYEANGGAPLPITIPPTSHHHLPCRRIDPPPVTGQ